MTYATASRTTSNAAPSLRQRWAGLLAFWLRTSSQRRQYRATVDELERMSDRDLADIGLHRSLIREVAYQTTYGA